MQSQSVLKDSSVIMDSIDAGPSRVVQIIPNIMLDITKKKLRALGFAEFRVKMPARIMLSMTNKGESTDDIWRTFPMLIDIEQNTIKFSISFFINAELYIVPENLRLALFECIQRINCKIPVGRFIYSFKRHSISFLTIANYGFFPLISWESILHEYLKITMAMYKSFGLAFVRIIAGDSAIKLLIKLCVQRTQGMVLESEEISESLSEENSSDSEDIMDPALESLLNDDETIKSKVQLMSNCSIDESLPFLIDLCTNSEFIEELINFLRLLYNHHLSIFYINLDKIRCRLIDNKIQTMYFKNAKKFDHIQTVIDEDMEGYLTYKIIEINKEVVASYKFKEKILMSSFEKAIIDSSKFQFKNIITNENVIGKGGFGVVYKNMLADIPVAIKIIQGVGNETKQLLKIIEEYETIQDLNHENIIKAYGFVKTEKSYGIVFEQCTGGSLGSVFHNTPSLKARLEIFLKIVKAIEYMHAKNYCHFDIKPSNILFDSNLQPKVTDLGFSRNLIETKGFKPGFTLIYCSPEQIKARKPDKKSDIWSLGMTFYNFLIGKAPFDYFNRKIDKEEFYNEITEQERRPRIPEHFERDHPKIVKLLRETWRLQPNSRPSCQEIRKSLIAIIQEFD